ncbi:MAG: ABC transporter substrate-binding protein [Candidatus Bipolaricaulia bacterium]
MHKTVAWRSAIVVLLMLALVTWVTPVVLAQVKITFWHAMSQSHQQALKALTEKFMTENPDIEVELVYQGNYGALNQKLIASTAAGQPPTMSQMYEDWTAMLLRADALVPLEPYFSNTIVRDLPESLLESNTYDLVLTTLPFNKSAMVLYYNTDLIETPPATWDELYEIAQELTVDLDGDGTIDQYGFGLRAYPEMFSVFFRQAGGQFLSPDMGKARFNSEAGVSALQFLRKMKDVSLFQSAYLSDVFGGGKVAMYIGSSAGIPFVARASEGNHGWSAAPLPAGPVNSQSMIQGTNLGVFRKASPEQISAAARYIEFLLREENTVFWAEETGYLPVTVSAIRSGMWEGYLDNNPAVRATSDELLDGFVYPHHAEWFGIRNLIGNALELVLLDRATPEEALSIAAAKVNELLAKGG